MIAYVETRLELAYDLGALAGVKFVKYVARKPEVAVHEVFVRRAAFDGEPPHEIILTVTPA